MIDLITCAPIGAQVHAKAGAIVWGSIPPLRFVVFRLKRCVIFVGKVKRFVGKAACFVGKRNASKKSTLKLHGFLVFQGVLI